MHRFEEDEIAEGIFAYVLDRCKENRLVDTHTYFVDSADVKASANKKKFEDKEVLILPKPYQQVNRSLITKNQRWTSGITDSQVSKCRCASEAYVWR